MKIIYLGDPIELAREEGGLSRLSTRIYGVTFPMNVEVDVSHLTEIQKRKLLNNGHFRPAGVDAPSISGLVVPANAVAELAQAEAASEQAPRRTARKAG